MANIHPTAVVEDGAQVAEGVDIGAFCHVGSECALGKGVRLHSHVCVAGDTHIGENTTIFPFASIGHIPQDLKYSGEKSQLRIGKNVTIREHVTMNPGTKSGGMLTSIGDNCAFLTGCHIAHDCQIGNNVVLVNNALIAGHCVIEDHVIVGGGSGVHQFVRIGQGAFIGGLTGVGHDVIPFGSVIGNRGNLAGLNLVGLRRRGIKTEAIHELREAYEKMFDRSTTLKERITSVIHDYPDNECVKIIHEFVTKASGRSFLTPWSWKNGGS